MSLPYLIASSKHSIMKAKGHETDAQISHIFVVGMLTQLDLDCVFAVLPPTGDLHAVAGVAAATIRQAPAPTVVSSVRAPGPAAG
jgi:hypothetical protein